MNGRRLSPEPARRFVFHFFSALLSQSANFSKGEGSASNSLFFALAMAMATFTVFQVLSVTYSGQVKGIVVARKMHSTTKFAMTVLSKCATHAGFVKVA